ncbi:DUF4833 domain-containing protein [Nostoc sp. FACHB-152]|uniref:DUF4833 domain-containing protein n=1 Tax=unclassified Nostoc TaxID=2593658 RepID=UPI0016835C58|nr:MULTISPECIES: DUF4833 domain-containing protein [unclassified Nostoc]MBD2452341.1 DUF4833 domain-containing protein [Nostoc sp. FACHB-152]MBD2472313.1 DUF4833 domain-containing protein [Nostoc sp. FACHB-145]
MLSKQQIFNPHLRLFGSILLNLGILLFPIAPSLAENIPSMFFVSSNNNKNQVHYGIKLNQDCSPNGSKPVFAYWRMKNGSTKNLSQEQRPAFDIATQSILGDKVNISLRVFESRGMKKPITIQTLRANDGICRAKALMVINEEPAALSNFYLSLANLKRFFGLTIGGKVVSITVSGFNNSQQAVEEIIPCPSQCSFGI